MAALSNLRDVLRYGQAGSFGTEAGTWDNPMGVVNNSEMGDDAFYASLLAGTNSAFDRKDGQWGFKAGGILDQINQASPGTAQITQSRDNQGAESSGLSLDYAKLPQTRLGSADKLAAVQAESKLINPDLVIDDPYYGKVTRAENVRSGNEMYFPLLMAALTMGAGSIGAFGPLGSQMMALVKGAKGLGEGKGLSLGSLANLANFGGG